MYAIREKSTGFWIPQMPSHFPQREALPTPRGVPKLFNRRLDAVKSFQHMLVFQKDILAEDFEILEVTLSIEKAP